MASLSLTDQSTFATSVLSSLGVPVTADNLGFIESWIAREGGGGANNPLNTTLGDSDSTNLAGNSAGVKNFTNLAEGASQTAATLKNGDYADILSALSEGTAGTAAASGQLSKGLSKWSGGGYTTVGSGSGNANLSPEQAADQSAAGANYRQAATADASGASLSNTYGYAAAFFNSDPSLQQLLQTATSQGMDQAAFQAAFQATPWYQNHASSMRQYLELKLSNPADYQAQLQQKTTDVMAQAVQMGAQLDPATAKGIADQSMQFGWDSTQLGQALATHVSMNAAGGNAADTQQTMQTYLSNMGVKYSPTTMQSDLQRIEGGQDTLQGWQNNIRTIAESAFPAYAAPLQAGKTVADIASPYLSSMASILELNPDSLSVNDPTIRQALTATDKTGQPVQTGLWQFEKSLMADPRWQYTKNAADTTYSTIHQIGNDFGFTS